MTKSRKIIYWVATLWLSLGMVATGIGQLLKMKEGSGAADSLAHLGYPAYLLTLLGICKMAGVAVVLAPRLPLLKEWAYAGFGFMMAAALYSHAVCGDGAREFFGPGLLLVLTAVSWYTRPPGRKIVSTSH
jgi:DoxX-like family